MTTIKELEQRLNRIDREKATIRTQLANEKRRGETKRKILFGVAALALAKEDSAFQERLLMHLDSTVRRVEDRELLGLAASDALDGKAN